MDDFLIKVLEQVMEPIAVLDRERKIIYCTSSFKALMGEKGAKDCACVDVFIPAFTVDGTACCWDLVNCYTKSKDCGFWISKKDKRLMICKAYPISINKDNAFIVVKLKQLRYDLGKENCLLCYDGFLNLIKDKGIETYRSYVKDYLRRLLKVKSVRWMSRKDGSSLSSYILRVASMGYSVFDFFWEGRLFHVIGPRLNEGDNFLLIQGLSDIGQNELTELICLVEFINSNTDFREAFSKNVHSLMTLTEREREVFNLILRGYSNQEIAHRLGIALNTVKNHVKNILSKTDTKRRTQLIVKYSSIAQVF